MRHRSSTLKLQKNPIVADPPHATTYSNRAICQHVRTLAGVVNLFEAVRYGLDAEPLQRFDQRAGTLRGHHFPVKELKKFGLRRETPDPFLAGLYDQVPDLMIGSLANARRNLTRTQVSAPDFIYILNGQKLVLLAKRVENHLADI
jgi:hypothetical protein